MDMADISPWLVNQAVRSLAEEQFMKRALIDKIRSGLAVLD